MSFAEKAPRFSGARGARALAALHFRARQKIRGLKEGACLVVAFIEMGADRVRQVLIIVEYRALRAVASSCIAATRARSASMVLTLWILRMREEKKTGTNASINRTGKKRSARGRLSSGARRKQRRGYECGAASQIHCAHAVA
jgi:hypothetical protein